MQNVLLLVFVGAILVLALVGGQMTGKFFGVDCSISNFFILFGFNALVVLLLLYKIFPWPI